MQKGETIGQRRGTTGSNESGTEKEDERQKWGGGMGQENGRDTESERKPQKRENGALEREQSGDENVAAEQEL